MLGTLSNQEPSLFSYHINLHTRVRADHPLRQVHDALDLSFVIPAVQEFYGPSGHVSLDPRVIVKLMFLLFYYNIPSERELMAQVAERLDFLWFLGFDLETPIPDHSVLSKARKRWGGEVFKQLFVRTVAQCAGAGLIDGRLLHVDSTIVKANASKNSVRQSCPEIVAALRKAYEQEEKKLTDLALAPPPQDSGSVQEVQTPQGLEVPAPAPPAQDSGPVQEVKAVPVLEIVAPPPAPGGSQILQTDQTPLPQSPVNQTHISTTDPQAHLAPSKQGPSQLSYKEHRAVDDAHGVITAVAASVSTVADGTQLPALVQQHRLHSGAASGPTAVAGDKHYGTAENYIYCARENLRAHMAAASANVEKRGQMTAKDFVFDETSDRYLCPKGHGLVLHQLKSKEQVKVYRIEDRALCANCSLRSQCTGSKAGRSIRRHVQAAVVEAGQAQAASPAGRYSRKRRRHVMEGSFADAVNNHASKRARWRGLARQQIQSWLICAVQNLRLLIRHRHRAPRRNAAVGLRPWEVNWANVRQVAGAWSPWRLSKAWDGLKKITPLPPLAPDAIH